MNFQPSNMDSSSIRQDGNPDYYSQQHQQPHQQQQPFGHPFENKENVNSNPCISPAPGFAPNPFLFLNNGVRIPGPPFYPPILQGPSHAPPFPPMPSPSMETMDESNTEGTFDRLQLQRLIAARALLNLKNNNFNTSILSTSDEKNESDLSGSVIREEVSAEERETSNSVVAQNHNEAEHGIALSTSVAPNDMPMPGPSVMQDPVSTTNQTNSFPQTAAPINPQLLSVINAITPKSKKAGHSTLLKSKVPGFNKSRHRATKRITPDCEKDSKYYERRIRNNISAKRSRDLRKSIEGNNTVKVAKYESENSVLRAQKEKYIEEKEYLMKILAEAKLKKGNSIEIDQEKLQCMQQTGSVNSLGMAFRSA